MTVNFVSLCFVLSYYRHNFSSFTFPQRRADHWPTCTVHWRSRRAVEPNTAHTKTTTTKKSIKYLKINSEKTHLNYQRQTVAGPSLTKLSFPVAGGTLATTYSELQYISSEGGGEGVRRMCKSAVRNSSSTETREIKTNR